MDRKVVGQRNKKFRKFISLEILIKNAIPRFGVYHSHEIQLRLLKHMLLDCIFTVA